jgi:hypothetical protein
MPQAGQAPAQEDTSFLDKYKAKPEGEDVSFLDKYRTEAAASKTGQGVIRATPLHPELAAIREEAGREIAAGPGVAPERVSPIENYTQEGRKAHPVLSRIGDATRNAREMLRVIGPELALLGGAPGGMNPAIGEIAAGPRAAPERLSPIVRAPEEIYQRPIEAAPGAGKGAAPAEMHPEELAAIRKEAGHPEMTVEDAHRFRINKTATAAASEKPVNDLGGMPRAGDEPGRLQPVGEKARAPRGYFNLGRGTQTPSIEDVVNQATGVKPLKSDVPLREQLPNAGASAEVAPAVDPVKAKYPDPAVRQMVRANGEKIVEAVGKNPELMKQLHDLTRVDLRQALINAGEDMGQKTVSNSKFAGEGSIGRQEAFDRLLAKGLTPEKIVELSKQKPAEGAAVQEPASKPKIETVEVPKPSRFTSQRETRERAGRIRAARINP